MNPREQNRDWSAWRGYAVHLYTASGIVPAFLAAMEISSPSSDPRTVFVWLALAAAIDATDGPLARRYDVGNTAPRIRGRTLDDVIDYLTFTFLPLLLVWRMDWLAWPGSLWAMLAMFASVLAFAHEGAKEEDTGLFRGFPSYWNVFAFYAGILASRWGTGWPTALLVALSVLTLLPVRFVYPNRAPSPWRNGLIFGGFLWLGLLGVMLVSYPAVHRLVFLLSLVYPAFYAVASLWLGLRARDRRLSASRD